MAKPARRSRPRRVIRAIVLRTPVFGDLLRERTMLRVQRRALLQDAENLRIAVGQLLTEVHKLKK
ncbi:MAG: hypothetical protein WEB06_03670 [Actinomycetota bacterium]